MSIDYQYSHHDRFLPAALEDRLIGLLARAAGLCLLTLIALVWLSLLSWSSSDPSLMHATGGEIRNFLGYFGSTIADLMLQTFGLATPLILLAPMFWAIELLLNERIKAFGTRATYFPLAILILAGALSALPVISSWPLHHGFGGILGDAVYRLGSSLMALVAPERAGALTGLTFFALGSASVTYSLGIELKDIAAMMKSKATNIVTSVRREPILSRLSKSSLSSAGASSLSRAKAWGHSLTSYAQRRQNLAYNSSQTGPGPQQDQFQSFHETVHQHNQNGHFEDQSNPELINQYSIDHAASSSLQAPGYDDGNSAPQFAPANLPSPNIGMADETNPYSIDRGDDFDGLTDATSRSIAQRFAPAHLVQQEKEPERVSPKPQPARQHPRPTQQTQPLHKGHPPAQEQPLRKGQPNLKDQPLLRGMTFNTGLNKYQRPSLNLLNPSARKSPAAHLTKTMLRANAGQLEGVLADFGVKGKITKIKPGPVVTLYELEPARGTKSSRVIGLSDDIARSMSAKSARIAVVEGRNAIGIELPNAHKEPVLLREILDSEIFKTFSGTLPISLGKSITGKPVIADLARMPHLLVAGTTGSGKSVGVNAMITSLLYRFSPDQCRILMIDPKMLELSVYNGIPHLLTPVVTDPHEAVAALNWVVGEMEERYKRMSKMSVRNIDIYNNRVRNARKRGQMIARTVQTGFNQRTGQAVFEKQQMEMEPMPYIVVVIDEFADLMIAAGKEVEAAVQRLAQMARAAGIHLIMATQRPSVDVITGTIKANFPTRISFKVASKVDSRTILNEQGAEQLLGQGDMLYSTGSGNALRVHGPFVSDEEVEKIVNFLRERNKPRYIDGITDIPNEDAATGFKKETKLNGSAKSRGNNEIYDRAVAIVLADQKASTSYLQRRLSIGYNRAADLIERMEQEGIVSPAGPANKREILAPRPASPPLNQ